MNDEVVIFGKAYKIEVQNKFVEMFRNWQTRFVCPKCKTPTMDFILTDKIQEPIICTNCHSLFDFILISKRQALDMVK